MSHIDLQEIQRRHDEVMRSARELEQLQNSNLKLAAKNTRPQTINRVGLIDSLIIMACILLGMIALAIIIAAIFL